MRETNLSMISIQKKFLFIHVPKTAGNSIQNILWDYSEDEIVTRAKHQDGVERFDVRNDKYSSSKHSTLSHYKSVLDANTYRSLFKFATVRNPWDLMVSYYFSPHRGITEWDRNDFVSLVNKMSTLREFICEKSFLDQCLTKLSIPRNIGNRQINRDIDFLMRFEQLNDDFRLVCEKLDIPYSPLPKRNKSNHLHYSKYYDDELRDIVYQKFIEEITFANYSFENA